MLQHVRHFSTEIVEDWSDPIGNVPPRKQDKATQIPLGIGRLHIIKDNMRIISDCSPSFL